LISHIKLNIFKFIHLIFKFLRIIKNKKFIDEIDWTIKYNIILSEVFIWLIFIINGIKEIILISILNHIIIHEDELILKIIEKNKVDKIKILKLLNLLKIFKNWNKPI
jgi:hypothetical protein